MPYIKRRYTEANSVISVYSNTTATLAIPNLNGGSFTMTHYVNGSKLLCQMLAELLTEANIAFTKVSDYVFDIWGVRFALLHSVGAGNTTTYGPTNAAVIPYGNCQYPIYANTANSNGQGRQANNWAITNTWIRYWDTNNGNKPNCYAFLYYNENCIFYALKNFDAAGGCKSPIFFLFKGKTVDNHDCAVMGGTPCSNTTAYNTGGNTGAGSVSGIEQHHEVFDLYNITHLFGNANRSATRINSLFPQYNVGQYGSDYFEDNLALKPAKDWLFNGYIKIDNLYYPDYAVVAADGLWDKVIEVNGDQYYIPDRFLKESNTQNHTYNITYHPVAIKL